MKTRHYIGKSLVVMLAALTLPLIAGAQNIEFQTETFGKMLNKTNEARFIGQADNSVVLVDYQKRKAIVARYDMAQNELARVEMGAEKDIENYGGFINGNNVDLLNVTRFKGGMRVYRDRRDLNTLQPNGEPLTLTEYNGNSDDKYVFTLGVSPNQNLLAGVSVMARKGLDGDVKVALYNRELEEYWHTIAHTNAFNQVIVNDSGEVVLAYCTVNTKKYNTFTIVDGEKEEQASFKLKDDGWPMEATLIRYGNGKLIMAVAVREENHTVMPLGSNIDRIDFYCYDVKKQSLTVEKHNFTDLECNRMANKKDDKSNKHHWVQFGNIVQSLADDEGAYLMFDQTWRVTKNDIPVEQHHLGMMVIRVNENGKIQWIQPLRISAQSSWGGRSLINYRWRSTTNGIVLAVPQNIKNADLPDNTPIKEFRVLKDKAVLSVITIDRKGKVKRNNFDIGKQTIEGAPHGTDSEHFTLFIVGSGKSQFGHLIIK